MGGCDGTSGRVECRWEDVMVLVFRWEGVMVLVCRWDSVIVLV